MKRIIIYGAAALALLSGCTDTTEIAPDEYVAPLYMDVSNAKVVFDSDGGSAAIVIATNAGSWEYVSDDSWFTLSADEDNILMVEAPVNYSPSMKEASVRIAAVRGEETVEADIRLVQRAERSVDLNAEGTSNCYLVKTGTTYKFDATVKGNGGSDGRSKYIENYGLEIEGIAYADLLWESRTDGDRTMSREIIDGAPVYSGGYVTFTTGRMEGNALIAVKDIKGNILWSWHIWVCDDDVTSHDHVNPAGQAVAQIMDRNLGALNNTPMDVNNRGMFYQWGRKDPFMPARSPYRANLESGNVASCNEPNWEVGDGSAQWVIGQDFSAKNLTTAPGNIPLAVANPTCFIYPYANASHWYTTSTDMETLASSLWSADVKTIFDPCPVGYKMPGKNLYGLADQDGVVSYKVGGGSGEYDENGVNPDYEWNAEKDCGRVWRRTGDYYPMAGNIYPTIGNTHNYASGWAYYWTAHEYTERQSPRSFRVDFNSNSATYFAGAENFCHQVRCVKE
ncbi:MAG: BACON domain-containing protein [Clostridium sp.]|nr:BACON domain-containing protein [Bacteroides sp.]MCM1198374.1 BACON domain-containing protein [Clostridium sp.]